MTLTFELDLDTVKMSKQDKYLGQKSIVQNLLSVNMQTHNGPIALPVPLKSSV